MARSFLFPTVGVKSTVITLSSCPPSRLPGCKLSSIVEMDDTERNVLELLLFIRSPMLKHGERKITSKMCQDSGRHESGGEREGER